VFVCDNLAFAGENKIARKHTRSSYATCRASYLARSASFLTAGMPQAQRIDAYRRHELTDVQAHDLIVRALDDRAITIPKCPPSSKRTVSSGCTEWVGASGSQCNRSGRNNMISPKVL
jgi:hypothetical protein